MTEENHDTIPERPMTAAIGGEIYEACLSHQVDKGYSAETDDPLVEGQLALAAAAYALHDIEPARAAQLWPFGPTFEPRDRRENLKQAAVRIAREIARLDRIELRAREAEAAAAAEQLAADIAAQQAAEEEGAGD